MARQCGIGRGRRRGQEKKQSGRGIGLKEAGVCVSFSALVAEIRGSHLTACKARRRRKGVELEIHMKIKRSKQGQTRLKIRSF